MLGNGRGYELYWVAGGGDVSVGPCLLPPAGSLPTSCFPATECQGQGGESCSSRMRGAGQELVLPAAGWRGKALVLRASFAGFGCASLRLLTATVSGQQAPASPTAMPAVPKLAEVIDRAA